MGKTHRVDEYNRKYGGRHRRNQRRHMESVQLDREDITTFIEADRFTRTMFPMF